MPGLPSLRYWAFLKFTRGLNAAAGDYSLILLTSHIAIHKCEWAWTRRPHAHEAKGVVGHPETRLVGPAFLSERGDCE